MTKESSVTITRGGGLHPAQPRRASRRRGRYSPRAQRRNNTMVIIVMGVCGCGKTTIGQLLAADLGWPMFDADHFHPRANIQKMTAGIPLTDADRRPWLDAMAREIRQWTDRGRNVVLACSALTIMARQILAGDDPRVKFVYLKGSVDLIRRRMLARTDHFMPPDLVESQFATLQEPHDALSIDVADSPQNIVSEIRRSLDL